VNMYIEYCYSKDRIGDNMRLFIAINFEEQVKEKIQEIIEDLEKNSFQGRFVGKEHLHLTLEFLGEIPEERVEKIKSIMDKPSYNPFVLKLSQIGYFKRHEGNIYWLGLDQNKSLIDTQRTLHKLLDEEGFKLEDRPYKPHITLGRKVKLNGGFNLNILADKINDITVNV